MNVNHSVILANIAWNEHNWKAIYKSDKAHHSYAKNFPGHESLNFDFNKLGLDNKKEVHGYIQCKSNPRNFKKGGTILFYTYDLNTHKPKIIGIYSNAEFIRPRILVKWKGFENNQLYSNIKAAKEYSMLFPVPLLADNYRNRARMVGQFGFTYYDVEFARKILSDELLIAEKTASTNEIVKLKYIFKYITGENYSPSNTEVSDEEEQEQLVKILNNTQTRDEIIADLKNVTPKDPELVIVRNKRYKRDNKVIAQLKILRHFKCQICKHSILKENGTYYIEAAHVIEKRNKGPETPKNILILCPNHHKEFDYGKKKIKFHNNNSIKFILNNVNYLIDLSLE